MRSEQEMYFLRMIEIVDLPEYNNAMIISQYIVDAMKIYSLSLSDIENILRSLKSRIYLIGFPLSFYNTEKYIFISKLPKEDKNFEYALWIEVNGLDALESFLEDNGWTDNDVDRSLKNTGFLMLEEKK